MPALPDFKAPPLDDLLQRAGRPSIYYHARQVVLRTQLDMLNGFITAVRNSVASFVGRHVEVFRRNEVGGDAVLVADVVMMSPTQIERLLQKVYAEGFTDGARS